LSEPAANQQSLFVYRRIHPGQWSTRKNRAGSQAFIEGEGAGLSLFRADLRSPRGVMQHAVDSAVKSRASADQAERERGEKQLARFGETVEEWLQQGWRVVRLPLAAFLERGYRLDEPDAEGHLNAFGEHSLHAMDLAMIAEELPLAAFDR
jgi:hypothetical protein